MRLIDADALDFTIPENPHFMTAMLVQVVKNAIDKAPTIEVKDLIEYHLNELSRTIHYSVIEAEPVRHGRWIPDSDKHAFSEECSVCGEGVLWEDGRLHHYNYCPHCGAKMDGGADDADSV